LPQIKAAFSQVLGRQIQVHMEVVGKNTAQPSPTSQAQTQPATTPVQSQTFTPTQTQPNQTPKKPGFYNNSDLEPGFSTVPEVSQPLPTPNLSDPTSQTVATPTIEPVRGNRDRSNVQSKSAPTPTETTVNVTKKPNTAFVDESEAIAAAEKLAEMFGGTVVRDFDDSDSFATETVEQNDPTTLEVSNPIEDLPDIAEEIVEEQMLEPEIVEEQMLEPEIVEEEAIAPAPVASVPEPQPSADRRLSAAEEEQILRDVAGEEYGDLEF